MSSTLLITGTQKKPFSKKILDALQLLDEDIPLDEVVKRLSLTEREKHLVLDADDEAKNEDFSSLAYPVKPPPALESQVLRRTTQRCPECGALVLMPCYACGLKAMQKKKG